MGIKLSQNLFGGIQDIIGQCFLSHWRTDGTTLSRKVQNKIWKIWHGQWKIKHWIQYDTVKSWHPQLLMIGSTKFHTVHFMVYFFRMMVAIYQLQRQVTGRHSVQLDAATHHGLALAMRNSPEQSLLLWKMLIHIGWIEYEFYRFYSICWILIYYHTSVYYIYVCIYMLYYHESYMLITSYYSEYPSNKNWAYSSIRPGNWMFHSGNWMCFPDISAMSLVHQASL